MDEDRNSFYIGTEVDPTTGQAGAPCPVSGQRPDNGYRFERCLALHLNIPASVWCWGVEAVHVLLKEVAWQDSMRSMVSHSASLRHSKVARQVKGYSAGIAQWKSVRRRSSKTGWKQNACKPPLLRLKGNENQSSRKSKHPRNSVQQAYSSCVLCRRIKRRTSMKLPTPCSTRTCTWRCRS